MAMIKFLAAAACVATAFGARVTNQGGDMLLEVKEGKSVVFKQGAAKTTSLADLTTIEASSYAASYFHLGYTSACVHPAPCARPASPRPAQCGMRKGCVRHWARALCLFSFL